MGTYLDAFPKIQYKIGSDYQTLINLTFRFGLIKNVLNNITAYSYYTIRDGDTPEILAEKIYNDPEAHWLILMANEIVDPQFDWPLDGPTFRKYIVNKYGSLAAAKTTYHHYEMVVQRIESATEIMTESRYVVDYESYVEGIADDHAYFTYMTLPETQGVETIDMGNGKTVTEITFRDAITNYDWENTQNEAKREIKIIKPTYFRQIQGEFDSLTKNARNPFIRTLR